MPKKLKECEMCQRYFYADRSTAKYCGTACRVAHHRGVTPRAFWEKHTIHPNGVASVRRTDFLAALMESRPELYDGLEEFRDTYGVKALNQALDIYLEIIGDDQ